MPASQPVIDAIVAEHPGYRPLTLDLFRPERGGPPYPLVIWVHGGAWRFGSNKQDGPQLAPARIGDRILDAGYALARVTYRLSAEATFPAPLHDVKAAVRWLRRRSGELGLDQGRFAMWGESAGGHLASLVALSGDDPVGAGDGGVQGVSDAVRAGVIWYAPSNLLTMAAQNHPEGLQDHDAPDSPESRLVGGPVQQMPKESAAASPVNYVTPDAPPLLLVHGEQDRIVPVGQSRELYERLHALGAPVELRTVPGADHCFVGADLGPLVQESLDFLARTLKPLSGRH
ncbi:alpha/beta hydrolase fold domain-containing protein [Actinoplanes sp. CA-252034]|uniref:alpha/beta hydrolase fold domain-containing protein n=1 Tax=Actinoplanes sp. CA-252034 TaxID=3239906 RepID=UPI003D988E1D